MKERNKERKRKKAKGRERERDIYIEERHTEKATEKAADRDREKLIASTTFWSISSLCHPCVTETHLSYSFLFLKLPPPPCAVLPLVASWLTHVNCGHIYHKPQQSLVFMFSNLATKLGHHERIATASSHW